MEPEGSYRVHTSPLLVYILSQMNQLHPHNISRRTYSQFFDFAEPRRHIIHE
jgi:hypothetical protein